MWYILIRDTDSPDGDLPESLDTASPSTDANLVHLSQSSTACATCSTYASTCTVFVAVDSGAASNALPLHMPCLRHQGNAHVIMTTNACEGASQQQSIGTTNCHPSVCLSPTFYEVCMFMACICQHVHMTWLKAHTDSLADAGFSPGLIPETSGTSVFEWEQQEVHLLHCSGQADLKALALHLCPAVQTYNSRHHHRCCLWRCCRTLCCGSCPQTWACWLPGLPWEKIQQAKLR